MAQFFSIDSGLTTSVAALMQNWLDYMQGAFPGYTPNPGNLEYVQALIFCTMAADVGQQASYGATELFNQFGQQLLNIPMETGSSAIATLQINAVDDAGYTLPGGSQFLLDGNTGFQTYADAVIPTGQTTTVVNVASVDPGSAANNLGNQSVVLNQYYDWVNNVSLVSASSNGTDAEDPDAYLSRLVDQVRLMAPRPITASDYQAFTLNFQPTAGTDQQSVGRATAIDGYNPADGTTGNERMVTVCVTDENGNALNSDTLTAIQGWLEGLREANFIVNVIAPSYQPIYATAQVYRSAGYDVPTVQASVQSALSTLFSPANWGLPQDYSYGGVWINQPVIYKSVVEAAIQQAPGVDHLVTGSLSFGVVPNPTTTGDLTLPIGIVLPTTLNGTTITTSSITVVN